MFFQYLLTLDKFIYLRWDVNIKPTTFFLARVGFAFRKRGFSFYSSSYILTAARDAICNFLLFVLPSSTNNSEICICSCTESFAKNFSLQYLIVSFLFYLFLLERHCQANNILPSWGGFFLAKRGEF